MTIAELRRRAKKRIERLSPERLRVADDFLAYLEEREENEATEELLAIPGFTEAFDRARAEVALMAGLGAVSPRQRPEDFAARRQEFEEGVAAEVTEETATSPETR